MDRERAMTAFRCLMDKRICTVHLIGIPGLGVNNEETEFFNLEIAPHQIPHDVMHDLLRTLEELDLRMWVHSFDVSKPGHFRIVTREEDEKMRNR